MRVDTVEILNAVERFINQRSGMDWRDYGTDADGRKAYQSEARSIAKDRREALAALREARAVRVDGGLLLEAFKRAFSGRLEWVPAPCNSLGVTTGLIKGHLSYTTGQYFPTEYRKAARAVLESYVASVKAADNAAKPKTFFYTSIADVRAANAAIGGHWFERGSMRFFNSVIESKLIGGRWFVTSERMDLDRRKLYSVREALPTGEIDTVGEFQGYGTREDAMDAVRELVWAGKVAA